MINNTNQSDNLDRGWMMALYERAAEALGLRRKRHHEIKSSTTTPTTPTLGTDDRKDENTRGR